MTLSATIQKRLSSQFSLNVALDAPPGITILFGASGSGKTTVLRCLAGLVRPDAGRIAVDDRVLFDEAAGVNVPVPERRIGYVFQQLALFPHLSMRQNIEYGLHQLPAGDRRERVNRIAGSFHIPQILDRKPAQVSGGERQRAALARSLVTDPSLLLLDEPLSALDHAIQSHIMHDLRRWNEERRIPILYVTHTHREVFTLGDRAVVLDRGRVLASGSPHEVLDHPAHGLLASLAGFENVFEAVVVERRERAGTMQCRLKDDTDVRLAREALARTEIEVPLSQASLGDTIRVAIRAGDILVANQQPKGLSARNVISGTLLSLSAQGPTMVATVDAGARFTVHLTPGGVESLELRTGDRLWLVIKTYSCRIIAE
jgi:molybdate transport system ATP-binding protein